MEGFKYASVFLGPRVGLLVTVTFRTDLLVGLVLKDKDKKGSRLQCYLWRADRIWRGLLGRLSTGALWT